MNEERTRTHTTSMLALLIRSYNRAKLKKCLCPSARHQLAVSSRNEILISTSRWQTVDFRSLKSKVAQESFSHQKQTQLRQKRIQLAPKLTQRVTFRTQLFRKCGVVALMARTSYFGASLRQIRKCRPSTMQRLLVAQTR